ncbi:MAG: hypothetical protein C4575_08550 [Desulforudis sp.]|jgi:hypothetical protein|nr:MAG: hypothetical protein C4575_08550 [Desulforudis sp.]
MDLVRSLAELDEATELHAARLLVLLGVFAGTEGTNRIQGLTKLAKLDFLLRYPVMLERALAAKKMSTRQVRIEKHERDSVESGMVRYRFGPWDHRYRMLVNILISKGLAEISIEGRTISVGITPVGFDIFSILAEQEVFEPYVRRSALLRQHFDLTATNLMLFIYKTFPEILSLRSNEVI